jgi:TRAP-type C4-dicarboxylate transport system permease small subunit
MEKKGMVRFYHRLTSVVNAIDIAELIVVIASLLAIIGINSLEIFTRFILNKSFFWVHEVIILLANYMYFLGAALVYKRRQDIQMEYFLRFFSVKIQRKWDFVVDGACFYFFVILFYHGIRILNLQSRQVSQGLGIPNHYFSLPLVIGTLSILLIIGQQFLQKCCNVEERR